MKKILFRLMLAMAMMMATTPVHAQLNDVINKAKKANSTAVGIKAKVNGTKHSIERATKSGGSTVTGINFKTIGIFKSTNGDYLYVNSQTGSTRADGKSAETAVKDLQKAIDQAKDGDVILVAEGNYLGNLDRGYIENGAFGNGTDNGKFISIIGGFSSDFSECDPLTYITKIQPIANGTAIKSCVMNFTARHPFGYKGPKFNMIISGLTFDMGEYNAYAQANVNDERTGTPNSGVLTGRFIEVGQSPGFPVTDGIPNNVYELHINVEDNLTITNCTFINASMFGIQGQINKGHVEISNNVFVACRYGACSIDGSVNDNDVNKVSLAFHHNTVLFPWPRTKVMEDMGQGFRFRNRIRTIDVYNNIFGCAVRCGVERTTYENSKELESAKESNLYDNMFFANNWDLEIANGASKGIGVSANRIEEADEIGPKFEGNMEMPANEDFINAIDKPYLDGYMSITIISSATYNANSAANQVNRALGLNQQGTEIVRPNMYSNKYPWMSAFKLYGAVDGYGAQIPSSEGIK